MRLDQVGIGISTLNDSQKAVKEAIKKVKERVSDPDITLVFFTDNYNHQVVFETCKSNLEKFTGACVPGVILGEKVHTKCVGACGIKGKYLEVRTSLMTDMEGNAYQNGEKLGEKYLDFMDHSDFGTLFVFPDGFTSNISSMLRGIYNSLGSKVSYVGGGSGDNLKFHKTWQFTEEGISSNAVATVLLKGYKAYPATGHGWVPKSEPLIITKSDGKLVYEIDGVPAFKRYSELLGGISKENFSYYGMKHPLGIPSTGNQFLIRDPIEVDKHDGILFISEIPQDTAAVIMEAGIDDLITSASEVTKQLKTHNENAKDLQDEDDGADLPKSSAENLVLVFDCVSRYLLMKDEFDRELKVINDNFTSDVFGILTFGEISSVMGVPFFYNKSIVMIAG